LSKTNKKKSTLETVKNEDERLWELTRRREEENRPKSYGAYLSVALSDASTAHREANETAELERVRAAAGYGDGGERLGRAGLAASGYADYLSEGAERAYRTARADADRAYAAERDAGERDYAKYLEQHEAKADKLLQNAIRRMSSDQIEGYDEGYRYAVASGLSGERAELFARMCDAYGRRDFRNASASTRISVLREIMQNGLDYDSAYLYARAVGASGATAKKIAEYASSIRESFSGFFDEP
jgi:hypothetical protein